MLILRRALLITAALVLLLFAWLWWNQPEAVDMAAYVPADTLVYVEANSLTETAGGLTSTDAWRALAPAAGLGEDFGRFGRLSRLMAWTGVGPADAVVLSRAQVALTVQGFSAAEESAATLKITPRLALVAETHTSESRVRAAVEKRVGDFARRAYGSPRLERGESDDAFYLTWTSPADERRRIVAAVSESVAIVGNDRGAVDACLAARRGERPALASDPQLGAMRERMGAPGALAFGYISPGGATRLLEVSALAYAGRLVPDPKMQSVVASLLPQLAQKVLGGAAWSARAREGALEDSYFLSLRNGFGARLAETLGAAKVDARGAAELLPADAYQLTSYNTREPDTAWRGLNAAVSSQLDFLSAPFFSRFLEAVLKDYGVEDPHAFLRAAGPGPVTARLDDGGASTVLVAEARDRAALQAEVRKRLGAGARTVNVGGESLLVSADEERGAAAFVGDHLIMGDEEDVRRCLEARAAGRTLAASASFGQRPRGLFDSPAADAVTVTDDRAASAAFVSYFGKRNLSPDDPAVGEAFSGRLARRAYAVTESRFVPDGYERKTLSSFGSFGALLARFEPERD